MGNKKEWMLIIYIDTKKEMCHINLGTDYTDCTERIDINIQ